MKRSRLRDGTPISCISASEAQVLDSHVEGYFQHGIALSDEGIVFDVGANIGVFGLRALAAKPGVRVYAFEPLPPIFAVLADNAARSDPQRFVVLPYGLAGADGPMQAWFFPNAPALSTGHLDLWEQRPGAWSEAVAGSLAHPAPGLEWTRHLPRFFVPLLARYLRAGARQYDCQLRTLSGVIAERQIPRIDLLKIDCEGAEESVLAGLSDEDGAKVRQAVIEVYDTEGRADRIEARLRRMGLTRIVREKEAALAGTPLINLYATREAP